MASPVNRNPVPSIVDRATWTAQISTLRAREKAHTREGDAIAAARRRLPMVEVDAYTPLLRAATPSAGSESTATTTTTTTVSLLDAFEGRMQLFASFHMWHPGQPAAAQCEGCTFNSGQASCDTLSFLASRGVAYAVFVDDAGGKESARYREFMDWEHLPWYGVPSESRETLLAGRHFGMKVCYVRTSEDRVFETYWTTGRGCEAMTGAYGMLDMTVYGRMESWEESPEGWPKPFGPGGAAYRCTEDGEAPEEPKGGRPIPQWARLMEGRSDHLGMGPRGE